MAIRESLLNTITSVASSDFVRIVTSAGASSKATVANLFKSFESGLGAKSSLTTSDYIRVVGSDNEAYKQSVSDVKSTMGVTTLENRFKYVSSGSFNDMQAYGIYLCQSLTNAPSTTYSQYALIVIGTTSTTKQIAFPTAGDSQLYIRHYVGGSWSSWAYHALA